MKTESMEAPALFSVNDKLPRSGQWVTVKSPSVDCLGFLDLSGVWHDVHDGSLIENVQAWQPLQE
jgi:hypothetical protein